MTSFPPKLMKYKINCRLLLTFWTCNGMLDQFLRLLKVTNKCDRTNAWLCGVIFFQVSLLLFFTYLISNTEINLSSNLSCFYTQKLALIILPSSPFFYISLWVFLLFWKKNMGSLIFVKKFWKTIFKKHNNDCIMALSFSNAGNKSK